jgi:hypothetical protein
VFLAITLDEAVGSNGAAQIIGDTVNLHTSTYSNPATGNASHTLQLMARGNGDTPPPDGSRLGVAAAWEGVALTTTQLLSIRTKTAGWFA